jgi:hypothetical protein
MSTKNNNYQKSTRWEKAGKTEIWHKDSAGCTTKEGHRTHHHNSGNVTDHYGRIIGRSKS